MEKSIVINRKLVLGAAQIAKPVVGKLFQVCYPVGESTVVVTDGCEQIQSPTLYSNGVRYRALEVRENVHFGSKADPVSKMVVAAMVEYIPESETDDSPDDTPPANELLTEKNLEFFTNNLPVFVQVRSDTRTIQL